MSKILITDAISDEGLAILKDQAEIIYKPGMSDADIKEQISDCDAMLIRSGTTVTEDIINACSSKMKVIGRAGVGVDNIHLESATNKGIIVINSPDGNTTAAAEHTITLMMSLARNISIADSSIKAGEWNRKAFTGIELQGKVLGIIGLGKIGSKVAEIASGIGMKIYAYDPYASPTRAKELDINLVDDINDIWGLCDVFSLHVPKIPQTTNLINSETISKMKDTARIINCSRGGIINEQDLADAIKSNKIAGAALDVFDVEPIEQNNPLLELAKDPVFNKKILLTPHLGAATAEAQINVSVDVAKQIVQVLNGNFAINAVNLKGLKGSKIPGMNYYMQLSDILGSVLYQLNKQHSNNTKPSKLTLKVSGKLTQSDLEPLVLSALRSYLNETHDNITLVNARLVANDIDIQINESKIDTQDSNASITLEAKFSNNQICTITGVLQDNHIPVITNINYPVELEQNITNCDFKFYLHPSHNMLVTLHHDEPGAVSQICQILGSNNININGLTLKAVQFNNLAMMICTIEQTPDKSLLDKINNLNIIEEVFILNIK